MKNKKVKNNSVWRATDGKYFKVVDIKIEQSKTWIHYHEFSVKVGISKKQYSCYEAAFLERFVEFTNVGYCEK